jgi:hypothetical protein
VPEKGSEACETPLDLLSRLTAVYILCNKDWDIAYHAEDLMEACCSKERKEANVTKVFFEIL